MKYKTAIFLIIGIIIMAVMLYFIGIDEVIEALKIANFWYILLAIIFQIFTYYLLALRWNIVNKIANIDVGIENILPMLLVGLSINNVTPSGRGGGEPVRAYVLSKYAKKPYEETFATVISDRALDMFPFLILSIISVISIILYFNLSYLLLSIIIISVIGVTVTSGLLIYMSINEKFGERITRWVIKLVNRFYKKDPKSLEKKVMKAISGFQKTMRMMLNDKKILYHALPLSFVIWTSEILRVYIVFSAFGVPVSPLLIGQVFILASLVGMIPLFPGGLGAIESLMIGLYSSAGITPSISAAATVIERLISFGMTTVIGLTILPYYGESVLDKIKFTSSNEKETAKELIEELDYIEEHEK
ncbi:MAG: UPF0104 family protein [Methanobacteriaceae archaeon]|jgi:uncharacterized protein (TIRG00374 family)|nr:UPF0104 family protein [Candidatus Methanorudis spinitermitis]